VETISGVPDAPGVYYFLDRVNKPVYIGKAKSLRDRLKSYFSGTAPSKSKKLLRTAKKLKIEPCNTELTAFLTEAEMIKTLKPKHNVMLTEYGNKYYLKIRRDIPFPRPEIVSSFDFDGNDYFGLFISRKKAQQVLEIVDKAFQLRECKDAELKKGRRCYLAEIERCTAPCENKNQPLYDDELKAVYNFLEGKNNDRLSVLINKMKRLSDALLFEQAGELKAIIELMLSQIHKSSLLSEPVNAANALILVNGQHAQDVILFLEGKVYIKDYLLSDSSQFFTALDDYFSGIVQRRNIPDDEDLEKMKISMNWMIKNKNMIKSYYLKNYQSKAELFAELSSMKKSHTAEGEYIFEIKDLINEFIN
ncbi:MAG: GIY-YIG nuclease family protein, partial [Ignavibacteriaceae bacterium]|nr:GIY-YIG nuclease family protein [Ignavibacteriaceae bacterium]